MFNPYKKLRMFMLSLEYNRYLKSRAATRIMWTYKVLLKVNLFLYRVERWTGGFFK